MRINWPVERALLATVTFVLATLTSSARSQHLNWSFADHPQPTAAELTKDEITAIERIESKDFQSEPEKFCIELPRTYFEIYNDRYPAFARIESGSARYLAWRAHIVERGTATPATCIVGDLSIRLMRAMSWPADIGLVYCGKYSRAPQNPQEKRFHDYLNELVEYARLGFADAISDLLVVNSDGPPVILNPDVEYYLRKTLEIGGEHEWYWNTSHLEPLLSAERVEFVNEAVKKRELNKVLQTTPHCASR